MVSRYLGMPSRNDGPPSIWTRMVFRETFFFFSNLTASLSAFYPQESNLWESNVSQHTSPHVMSENQKPAQDQRCQSGPWARNSFDFKEGRSPKDYGADQQRLQISDLHWDKFTTPATFACWKIRFKIEVWICSQFLTEAMLWIIEVRWLNLRNSNTIFWGIRRENCFSTEPNHP